jgi:hypothetical protein
MSSKLKRLPDLPQPGRYRFSLRSVNSIPSPLDPRKQAIEFQFGDGTCAISKVTGAYLRANESLEKLLESMLGRRIAVGEEIDLEAFVGKLFEVVVAAKGDHGVTIASVRPVAE